jgi:ribosomal protein S18 acetylase RimI-like enzyme
MSSNYQVVRIDEQAWRRLRDVRLAALAADPSAFGSSLDRESRFEEDRWRAWPRTSACFLAEPMETGLGQPVPAAGLAVGKDHGAGGTETAESTVAELNALWVAPEARGLGVGAALVTAVLDWAQASGKQRLTLWVTSGNAGAIGLYERLGFGRTGAVKPLPSDPELTEVEYALLL